jgi:hypothetical protein
MIQIKKRLEDCAGAICEGLPDEPNGDTRENIKFNLFPIFVVRTEDRHSLAEDLFKYFF